MAQEELRKFKEKYKRLPGSKDKGMRGITHAIARREWEPQGIITWNDLMEATFNDLNMSKYVGKRRLERAKAELKEFERQHNRLPKQNDKGLFGIRTAVYRREWKEFGIIGWEDMLIEAFGKQRVNTEKNKPRPYRGQYVGKKGLERAIKKIRAYYDKYGVRPTSSDVGGMSTIARVIRKGVWKEFGITSWEYLLDKAFEEEP